MYFRNLDVIVIDFVFNSLMIVSIVLYSHIIILNLFNH